MKKIVFLIIILVLIVLSYIFYNYYLSNYNDKYIDELSWDRWNSNDVDRDDWTDTSDGTRSWWWVVDTSTPPPNSNTTNNPFN